MQSGSPWWIKLLLGLVGLVLAGVAALYTLGAAATSRWEEYAASLRAKGQPLTFEEIEAQRAVIPDDQNSALIVARLADRFKELGDSHPDPAVLIFGSRKGNDDFFEGVGRTRIDASRRFIEQRRELLAELETLRDKLTGRFDIRYDKSNPILTLLPHLSGLREKSKLARLDGMLHLIDNRPERAVGDFELQCRLAGTLFDEPTLISRLVQIAIEAQACRTVEDILRVGEVGDETLAGMADELTALKTNGTMRWAMLGERAFFIETCEAMMAGRVPLSSISTGNDTPSERDPIRALRRLPAFLARSNERTGTEMYTWLVDAADDPDKMRAAAARIDTEIPKLSKMKILVKIMMPSLSRAVVLSTKITAQLECALAGLAAERFRLATGQLPKSLEELVPQYLPGVPNDPFDAIPLHLKTTDDGIVIYSIDDNLIDDGGDVAQRPSTKDRKRAPDVGFRLFRPDRRGLLLVDDPPPDEP
jgi:hypothetical protein